MINLNLHLARELVDDRSRGARERRRTSLPAAENHERQGARVQASLLLSPRQDRPTQRRWV